MRGEAMPAFSLRSINLTESHPQLEAGPGELLPSLQNPSPPGSLPSPPMKQTPHWRLHSALSFPTIGPYTFLCLQLIDTYTSAHLKTAQEGQCLGLHPPVLPQPSLGKQ